MFDLERMTVAVPGDVTVQEPRLFESVQLAPSAGGVVTDMDWLEPLTTDAQPAKAMQAAPMAAAVR
jgi:hypothetical protein